MDVHVDTIVVEDAVDVVEPAAVDVVVVLAAVDDAVEDVEDVVGVKGVQPGRVKVPL